MQHVHLAQLYARIGYPEAALEEANGVRIASARMLCQIYCLLTAGHQAIDAHQLDMVARQLPEIEDLLQRLAAGERVLQPASAMTQQAPGAMRPFTALVADDNVVNREVAVEALSQLGGSVTTVENGAEAVAALQAARYDVVFMDGSMPEMDGFEATRRIRAREAAEGMPRQVIVALTAHVVGAAADAWREAGFPIEHG